MTTTPFSLRRTDPYRPSADHARRQTEDPISWTERPAGRRQWVLTRWEDVRTMLADTRFSPSYGINELKVAW